MSLLLLLHAAAPAAGDQRLNRSGYISVTMSPLLYESNLWQTSYRQDLEQLFKSQAEALAEGLAEGLEKTAFRGRLRPLPGYLPAAHAAPRDGLEPDNFLITVDMRSSYGLSEGSSLATCLSAASCFLLSPLEMFSYNSRTEASVGAFYITAEGKKLRLAQHRYRTEGGISGDFFDAMDLARELEWITLLTDEMLNELKGKILAELPAELVRRSRRKAADAMSRPAADGTASPPLPPAPIVSVPGEKAGAMPISPEAGSVPAARQTLDLQELVRRASPSIFKVRTAKGTGSGFVISRRGYGLTSLHVVDGAGTVTIRFLNGEELAARVILSEPSLDVAVLSLPPRNLTPLPLGDSDRLAVGDNLVAIGYPLELGLSVVTGEVSSLEGYRGVDLIRIDTPLAAGNSGGALVNAQGEGVGINFSKSIEGKGKTTFAIPINTARRLFAHLLDTD